MNVLLKEFLRSEAQVPPPFGEWTFMFLGDYAQLLTVGRRFYMKTETGRQVRQA